MRIYLDLLPQEKKDAIRRNKIFGLIVREEIFFLLPLIVFVIILFNIYYLLNLQHDSLLSSGANDSSRDQYQQLAKYEERFKSINTTVDVLSKIQSNHLYWTNALTSLSLTMPDGVYLSNLASKNYQLFLVGKARSRDDLLNLKTNLEQSSCFQNINVPLSNLVVKNDIDFQMDVEVKKECLNKK